LQLLPPPDRQDRSKERWDVVEEALGLPLPSDYKRIVETYGCGSVDDWFGWFYPFGKTSFDENATQLVSTFFDIKESEEYDQTFYPDPGGILPFATNDNANVLCWKTDGPSDKWQLFWWNASESTLHKTKYRSFLTALVDILRGEGKLSERMLPANPKPPHHFIVYPSD